MNRKKKLISLLLMGFCFFLSACESSTDTQNAPSSTVKVEKAATASISDLHLRDRDHLYDEDHTQVTTMYLTVRRGDAAENQNHAWSEINQYSSADYRKMKIDRYQVAGLLQVGNEEGPVEGELGYGEVVPNASVQVRGDTSSKNAQKNYKIKIKKNKGEWNGQRTINLNKHQGEALRFRNKLVYDLIEEIPQIMGARTRFVHLYVKDETNDGSSGKFEDYGLYTQVEQINKNYLEDHGLDKNGQLYKPNLFEFQRYEDQILLEDDPGFNKEKFEEILEIKGDHDHSKLIDFLEKLNNPSITVDTLLKEYVDEENVQYWMALQILVGNRDTQSRNMYLYSPQNSTKWYLIPWDNDGSFTKHEDRLLRNEMDHGWESGVSNYWGNMLFQRLLKSDSFREKLSEKVDELHQKITKEKVLKMGQEYARVIQPYLKKMPDQLHARAKNDQYQTLLDHFADELEENYQGYQESLTKPQPFFVNPPELIKQKLKLSWGASYDFNNSQLRYKVEIAKDIEFKDKVFEASDVSKLEVQTDPLPKGQYFIRVTATNASDKSQLAFDYYVDHDNQKHYGVKSFYVLEDGKVEEDRYEE